MRTSKYSEGQIVGFLRQAEADMPIKELCRKHGFSDGSFYKWRSKYGGMDATEAKRLRELELENGKLNRPQLVGAVYRSCSYFCSLSLARPAFVPNCYIHASPGPRE